MRFACRNETWHHRPWPDPGLSSSTASPKLSQTLYHHWWARWVRRERDTIEIRWLETVVYVQAKFSNLLFQSAWCLSLNTNTSWTKMKCVHVTDECRYWRINWGCSSKVTWIRKSFFGWSSNYSYHPRCAARKCPRKVSVFAETMEESNLTKFMQVSLGWLIKLILSAPRKQMKPFLHPFRICQRIYRVPSTATFESLNTWMLPVHNFVKNIFDLVVAAQRPVTIEELREAISIKPGDTTWDASRLVNDMLKPLLDSQR